MNFFTWYVIGLVLMTVNLFLFKTCYYFILFESDEENTKFDGALTPMWIAAVLVSALFGPNALVLSLILGVMVVVVFFTCFVGTDRFQKSWWNRPVSIDIKGDDDR
jgi:hypothetical protein